MELMLNTNHKSDICRTIFDHIWDKHSTWWTFRPFYTFKFHLIYEFISNIPKGGHIHSRYQKQTQSHKSNSKLLGHTIKRSIKYRIFKIIHWCDVISICVRAFTLYNWKCSEIDTLYSSKQNTRVYFIKLGILKNQHCSRLCKQFKLCNTYLQAIGLFLLK